MMFSNKLLPKILILVLWQVLVPSAWAGCPKYEKYLTNGPVPERTCDKPKPVASYKTKAGCFCVKGYIRDHNGNCILEANCSQNDSPPQCSKANEEFNDCGSACPDTCDNYKTPRICTDQCVVGCFCTKGFVRNSDGNCVLTKNCPKKIPTTQPTAPTAPRCTRENEVFTTCGSACPDTCDNFGKPRICTKQCVKGCFCKTGYARDANGNCILPKNCPPKIPPKPKCNKPNEAYSECPLCENFSGPGSCTRPCKPGCYCLAGYTRDANGSCVAVEPPQPVCTKLNEEYTTCGTACPDTCDNWDTPRVCTRQCVQGCFCKAGFVRDANGDCITTRNCPARVPPQPVCTRLNEEYTDCGTACPDTCDNWDTPRACTLQCVQGCFCKAGFVRDANGDCITTRNCPARVPPQPVCTRLNEEYTDCGTACPDTCDNWDTPRACTLQCVQGCFCKAGFVRDANGDCITTRNCPARTPKCDKPNEAFSECPLCENFKGPGSCTRPCSPGCYCLAGYFRDENGDCVEEKAPLPECTKRNEVYNECGSACPDTCDNFGQPRICTRQCVPGCFCKTGFARDLSGNCIPPEECPRKEPTCSKPNEVYNSCGSACPDTCDNFGQPRVCTKNCVPGCFCKTGFARDAKGNCILTRDCPVKVVIKCKSAYEMQPTKNSFEGTCECPEAKNRPPKGSCVCKSPAVRDSRGQCVPLDRCPEGCSGKNEFFDCGSACDTECATLGEKCTIINKKCNEKCYCMPGYARDHDGECILIENCPAKNECDDHDDYDD